MSDGIGQPSLDKYATAKAQLSGAKKLEEAWVQAGRPDSLTNSGGCDNSLGNGQPWATHDHPCPSCGYCRHCGRGGGYVPNYPPPPTPTYPPYAPWYVGDTPYTWGPVITCTTPSYSNQAVNVHEYGTTTVTYH